MKPNILLVVMDSVRASNTSLHGHENETTPFLESLSQEATVYEQARSSGSWSLPSHTSLFTGYNVAEHGVVEPDDRIESGHTIFETLRDDGYATAVFSENPWLTAVDTGLDAGFETTHGGQNLPFPDALDPVEFTAAEGQGEYQAFLRAALDDAHPVRSLFNGVYNKIAWDIPWLLPGNVGASAPASEYGDLFLEWSAERDGPWAACINFMDAHAPYEPADDHDRWGGEQLRTIQRNVEKPVWSFHGGDVPWWQAEAMEALYDGCIKQIDVEVARLVDTLRQRGELDDTLLVVTSDHGEGFGEPSSLKPDSRVIGHIEGIHEKLVHVPLVVKYPGQEDPERISGPATLTQFPEVVHGALADERRGFVPDSSVVVSSHGVTQPNMRLAEAYCEPDSLWQFQGDMRAVYDANGTVKKSAVWEDESVKVTCIDAKTSYVSERNGVSRSRVDEVFDSFEDAGVRRSHDFNEVSDGVERRLQELGYAD
jgi:arylsulfatase A-like enzyme